MSADREVKNPGRDCKARDKSAGTHIRTPAMNETKAIGPTDKYRRGAYVAGFWQRNNVSPCADLFVSMCRLKNWGKQVFTLASYNDVSGCLGGSFCFAARPPKHVGGWVR